MRFPRELNDHETAPSVKAPFPFYLIHPMNDPMIENYRLMEVVRSAEEFDFLNFRDISACKLT